jgi:hypothetical protein|tara:strand:+ start:1686 stop:1922 length:237 start_codon:yes stop_codon:yes gene_type:complete
VRFSLALMSAAPGAEAAERPMLEYFRNVAINLFDHSPHSRGDEPRKEEKRQKSAKSSKSDKQHPPNIHERLQIAIDQL